MKEILGNARRQHRRPVFNRQSDDDYAKQIAPRCHVTCPAHHLGLGMA
jgi:hypothetical protein